MIKRLFDYSTTNKNKQLFILQRHKHYLPRMLPSKRRTIINRKIKRGWIYLPQLIVWVRMALGEGLVMEMISCKPRTMFRININWNIRNNDYYWRKEIGKIKYRSNLITAANSFADIRYFKQQPLQIIHYNHNIMFLSKV